MSTSYSPNIVTDGLVLYLDAANSKSYVSGSNFCYSLVPNGVSGSLTNGPVYDTGSKGNIVFDGSNDHILTNNYNFINNTDVNHSMFAWVKPKVAGGIFLYFCYGEWSDSQWATGLSSNNGEFCWPQNGAATTGHQPSGYIMPTGSWTHVGVVRNGIDNITNFYVNGILYSSATPSYGHGFNVSTSNPFVVGAGGYNGQHIGFFNGAVAGVLAYTRLLSSAEVLQNYNSTKGRYGL